MKNPLVWDPFRFWVLVAVIIPLLAVLVTWTTGYLYISYGLGGFPAPWARFVYQMCPLIVCPVGPLSRCLLCDVSKIVGVNIDWLPLSVDILFYTGIGYSMILAFSRVRP